MQAVNIVWDVEDDLFQKMTAEDVSAMLPNEVIIPEEIEQSSSAINRYLKEIVGFRPKSFVLIK